MQYMRVGQFWLFLLAVGFASLFRLPSDSLQGGTDKILHLSTYLLLLLSLDFAYLRGSKLLGKLLILLLYSW